MSTHNICFYGEIEKKKYQYFWLKKAPILELHVNVCEET